MTMKIKNIFFIFVTAFFACFWFVPSEISAADTSVTLSCLDEDSELFDMEWNLYRIGEKTDGGFKLTEDFARYSVDLQDMSAENIRETANILEAYATAYKHIPVCSGYTDENGSVTFSGLENGLYLASGKKVKYGNYGYRPSPVLIEVSGTNENQTIFPKFYRTSVFSEISTTYELKKVWIDNDNAYEARPLNITIDIYKDGELAETVILSEENNWGYRWVSHDPFATWTAVERKIPRKYVVSVEFNSKQYLIKNSYKPDIAIDWDEDFDIISTETTSTTSEIKNTTTTTVSDVGIDTDDMSRTSSTSTDDVNNSSDTKTTANTDSLVTVTNTTVNTDVTTATNTDINTNTGTDTNTNTNTDTDTDSGTNTTVSTTTTTVNGGGSSGGSGGGLPQTGQLWWPVIPLSLSGVMFVFIGIKIKPKKENHA